MAEGLVRVLQLHTPQAIRAELERVGADLSTTTALAEQLARAEFYLVELKHASLPLARLLYQELTIEGGQVVTAPRLEHVGEGDTAVLLCATRYQFNHLLVRLRWQPSDELQFLAEQIERALDRFIATPPPLVLGTTIFDWQRPYVMGILNLTPDSFSGDALLSPGASELETIEKVLARAQLLVTQGADILDIGGESTRPNFTPVSAEIELQRVLPALRALHAEFSLPLSIDTTKPEVAAAALEAGAHLVNDVSGKNGDPALMRVSAEHQAAIVLTHNGRGEPAAADFMSVILETLDAQIELALAAGIAAERIVIDPGLGFGKTPEQNLGILNRLTEFRMFGAPLLIGPSRKGFISTALDLPVTEREEGTAAAVAIGIAHGAHIVRVHNVQIMTRVARMTAAILHSG